ncbi:MAG: sensor histidine kinase N-terminal domain-containing protein [Pigmentiphaga sp.]
MASPERATPAAPTKPARSLFGQILDWMLVPLFLLWPIGVAMTYLAAQSVSQVPYDRGLATSVRLLAEQVVFINDRPVLQGHLLPSHALQSDETDSVFFSVIGGFGEALAGDAQLPRPPDGAAVPGVVQFSDEVFRGFPIRMAYTWVRAPHPSTPPTLVQVAETLEKRSQLANEIIKGVIIPQFLVLPIAIFLLWFGLLRGIAPLQRLQARLKARSPNDLSPINEKEVPQEVAPLVAGMNDLLRRLSANIEAQQRFVADAAHQLKTPLAGMRTQAELAMRTTTKQDIDASLQHLLSGAERATRVVNQLLAMARAEDKGILPTLNQPLDLNSLASEQTFEWIPVARQRSIDLGFEESETPAHISGNALLLTELLSNLLDNALRYTPLGGTVTVRIRKQDDRAILEVEDSGPGIPVQDRMRVFDRFYRVLGTQTDGSGLGLAIVKQIALLHQADTDILDNPSQTEPDTPGTLIRVTFPEAVLPPPVTD